MKVRLVLAVQALLLLVAPVAAQDAGVVHGLVRSASNDSPAAQAVVEIISGERLLRAIADSLGRYRLTSVPAGRGILRVQHIGHEPLELEISVSNGRETVVDLALAVRPVPLTPIMVQGDSRGGGADSLAARDAELGLAGTRALETTPGLSELGIADAVRGIPGKEPSDPGSVLYVRGAAADLKLVYLDGAPVYAPFPLGGLLDPFSPEVLHQADIYLGGAPARYDGGLSYVMDLRTRASNRQGFRATGAADLLSVRGLAEVGISDRLGLVATGRGIHPGSAILGDALPYRYQEGLLRGDALLTSRLSLSATGFINEEAVRMGGPENRDSVVQWGNRAASVRLIGELGETSFEMTAAGGDYSATLPLSGNRPLIADAAAGRTRLSADFLWAGPLQVRYGLSHDRQRYRASAVSPVSSAPARVVEGSGSTTGLYVEGSGQVGARVRLRGGGRVDHFSTTGEVTFAPRFAATWLITERAAMTLAAGTYHQFLRPPDEVLLSSPGTSGNISTPLAVARASHFAAALDQDLGDDMRLGIEAFFKDFSDVPGAFSMEANASGVDFWVRRGGETWNGWLGYSLAWVWSSADSGEETSRTDFTGRHLLSAGLGAPIGERTQVDLRFAYGAGLPYAGIPLATDQLTTNVGGVKNSFESSDPGLTAAQRGGTETAPLLYTPDSPFLRLDASISQRWSPRWGGRNVDIRPYLKLLNGLGRRDALFYFFDEGAEEEPTAIGTLPVVPVLGVSFEF